MTIINAKQFAQRTGYPLAMIRALCRENRLPLWECGRVYLMDEAEALAAMQTLKATKVKRKLLKHIMLIYRQEKQRRPR